MRRLILVVAVLAAFALGMVLGGGDAETPTSRDTATGAEPTIWTCSMHPQIQLPEPGQCPICFMDLIPLEDAPDEDLGPRAVVLTESAAALAEIRTAPVETATADAAVPVRMTGRVDYDETSYRTIAAWIPGRIDTLLVNATGMVVREGQGLASLYSPELYRAQVELLDARAASRQLEGSPDPAMVRSARETAAAARRRLELWGLSADQVREIESSGRAREHVRIPSPLSGVVVHKDAVEGQYVTQGARLFTVADLSRVWVTLDAYESDIAWLAVGQDVGFTVAALPGRDFTGRVVFIDPVLDERTRSIGVRVEVDNPEGELRPGMYVRATAAADIGQLADGQERGGPVLVIPATAPLVTGTRAVVYVRVPGHAKPTFEGREVVLGPRLGDRYVVREGLTAGEQVVVHGNFKLDSALQIQAKPSMMSPDEADDEADDARAAAGPPTPLDDVPDAFRAELTPVLDGYLALQAGLAADDDAAARTGAERTLAAVRAVDMSSAGPAHAAWMADAKALADVLAGMAAAETIEARRATIQQLSDLVWGALVRYGYRDDRTIRQFHCPMARDGVGGDWIQLDPVTANPYYGAMMLRCGSETAVLDSVLTEAGR